MRDPESGPAALPRFWKIPVIQEATPKRTCGCELGHPERCHVFIGPETNEIGTNFLFRLPCGESWLPANSDALAKEKSRKGVVGIITSGRDHDTLWDVDPAKGNCV
jgi:hypothetical protein